MTTTTWTGNWKHDQVETVFASGTAAELGASYAAVNFGGTDPAVSLAAPFDEVLNQRAATFLLFASAKLDATGASGTYTANLKLRRTNNTAADVSDSAVTITDTFAAGNSKLQYQVHLGPVPYVHSGSETPDSISLFGQDASATGVEVQSASIVAIRLG